MPYIASTSTCPTSYTEWSHGPDNRLIKGRSVVIKGGYGMANENFVTPQGAVITEVTEDELNFLQSDHHFKEHEKNGFVTIIAGRKAPSGERVEKDMSPGDKSQPIRPEQFKNDGNVEDISVHSSSGK